MTEPNTMLMILEISRDLCIYELLVRFTVTYVNEYLKGTKLMRMFLLWAYRLFSSVFLWCISVYWSHQHVWCSLCYYGLRSKVLSTGPTMSLKGLRHGISIFTVHVFRINSPQIKLTIYLIKYFFYIIAKPQSERFIMSSTVKTKELCCVWQKDYRHFTWLIWLKYLKYPWI